MKRVTGFISPYMNKRARTSDKMGEEKELTMTVIVSVSDSASIREQIYSDPGLAIDLKSDFCMKYDWLNILNKLDCTMHRNWNT
jgi:hypothetical protein